MTKVLYPGSFDPITKGHMDIIKQTSLLFDEIYVAILQNPKKKDYLFSLKERLEIIENIYKDNKNVKVITSNGAAVDIAIELNCQAIVRGLRGLSDYDYEVQLAQINKEISNNKINTICLFADKDYQFISSSMVKEIFYLDKSIDNYIDPIVKKKMLEKRKNYE